MRLFRLLACLAGTVLAGGCGSLPGGGASQDGDAGAVTADAAVIDGTATVVVLDDGEPAPHARVLVHDAAGNLVDERRTGGQGEVAVAVPVDGAVSAVWSDDLGTFANVSIQTVLAVEAGDRIELDRRLSYAPEPPPAVASITIEPGGAPPATYYEVHLGCTSVMVSTLPADIEVPSACLGGDGAVDVLVTAVQVTGGEARILVNEIIAYAAARVALVDAQASYTPAAWHEDWDAVPVATDPPLQPYVGWTLAADGLAFPGAPRTDAGLGRWRDLAADGAVASGLAETDDGYAVFDRGYDGVPAEVTLGAVDLLPDAVAKPGLAMRRDRTVISWSSSDENAASADGVYASIAWEGDGVADGRYRWEVVAPIDQREIALPVLPDDLSEIVSPLDLETWDFRVELLDGSWIASFADLKAMRLHGGLQSMSLLDLPPGDALLRRTGNGPLFP